MSPRSSTSKNAGGPYRKPNFDLYSMLLLLSLMAILAGSTVLYLHMVDYRMNPSELNPPFRGGPTVPPADDLDTPVAEPAAPVSARLAEPDFWLRATV